MTLASINSVAEFVFWFGVATVAYIYVGYPCCLWLLGRLFPRPVLKEEQLPVVTVLIPAFNEADCIRETVENKLAQNYPVDKLNIIVVSDDSTDGTDQIVNEYASRGVTLLRQVPRQGKSAGLNLAIKSAIGHIVVFSDANSIYEPGAIRMLVRNFADPAVGYVTGKMIYANSDGSVTGDGCSSYMRYENILRSWETRIGSIVGVDGGIDAMRRSLYRHLNADQLPDFVQPLHTIDQGYRVIYESEAVVREEALADSVSEYRMRVRVSLRALWALRDMRSLMNPFKQGLFAWQLISHKLLRYLAFLPLSFAYFGNALLLSHDNMFYRGSFVVQTAFYALAWTGYRRSGRKVNPSYLTLPYYFTLLNWTSAVAFVRFLRGEKQVLWQPRTG